MAGESCNNSSNVTAYTGGFCPPGYNIAYNITTRQLPNVPLSIATTYLSNWTGATPGMIVNTTGYNTTGSTRTYISSISSGAPVTEILTAASFDDEFIMKWSDDDVTVFSSKNNVTTIQFFTNLCSNNKTAAYTLIDTIFTVFFTGYDPILGNLSAAAATKQR
ncbi:MAG: hypothetical protein CYPHOPRED_004281 [Cyphobasidiales sp. Tagirdzhanova-0007]|nr:MAG: hypothetical protein CYPHOPRED_004281 [Cyphobasidiales sp. Tagirdzhanova-0007]